MIGFNKWIMRNIFLSQNCVSYKVYTHHASFPLHTPTKRSFQKHQSQHHSGVASPHHLTADLALVIYFTLLRSLNKHSISIKYHSLFLCEMYFCISLCTVYHDIDNIISFDASKCVTHIVGCPF